MISNAAIDVGYIVAMGLAVGAVIKHNNADLTHPEDDGQRFFIATHSSVVVFGRREMFSGVVLMAMFAGLVIGACLPLVWISTAEPTMLDRITQVFGGAAGTVIGTLIFQSLLRIFFAFATLAVVIGGVSIPLEYIVTGEVNGKYIQRVVSVATSPLTWANHKIIEMHEDRATAFEEDALTRAAERKREQIAEEEKIEARRKVYHDNMMEKLAVYFGTFEAKDPQGRIFRVTLAKNMISVDEPGLKKTWNKPWYTFNTRPDIGPVVFYSIGDTNVPNHDALDEGTVRRMWPKSPDDFLQSNNPKAKLLHYYRVH